MTEQELFSIGKIIAPHGVRGDVRIIPLTDFPQRFYDLKTVYIETYDFELAVESVRPHQKFFLVKFLGYNSPEEAASLRGKHLKVRRDQLFPLPHGNYYIFDIIGLKAFTQEGVFLGEITDVLSTGSNDVYVIGEEGKGKQPLLIPALKEVVKKIDIENKEMIVSLQEEWK